MKNHWLRKKVARELFSKYTCRLEYQIDDGISIYFKQETFSFRAEIPWVNLGPSCRVNCVRVFDEDGFEISVWRRDINIDVRTNDTIVILFKNLKYNGFTVSEILT
jgi:hypothetical protein